MNPQRPQRRSSEVRGCLLRNFLDMRKRSLMRSESQDSGFSLESYEPFMNSSFDAEKFLEELGFVRDNGPLIPDRFIPSLIHRISGMPDETVMKLDTRVWNSIDSFKKKEHTLWFFTQSSVECDLCINDLQRSYSVPSDFSEMPYDSSHPSNSIYALGNSSSSDSRVQNWLSWITEGPLTPFDKAKANIACIGNQSSTESGILSALSDDEAYTATNHIESLSGVNYSYCPPTRVSIDLAVQETESLKRTPFEKCRTTPRDMPSSEVRDSKTRKVNTVLCLGKIPNGNYKTHPWEAVSLIDACTAETSPERCPYEYPSDTNSISSLNKGCTAEESRHDKPVNENFTEISMDVPTEFLTCNGKDDQDDLNKIEQLCSVTENTDSDRENDARNCYDETEDGLKDDKNSIHRASLSKTTQVSRHDNTKKRHSFDAAYLTAAEKRKRFRLSHSKTHNFLFEKEDSSLSASHLRNITADDTTSCDAASFRNIHEETANSDQLSAQNGDDVSQYFSHPNGDTPSEVSSIVSSVDISHRDGGNPDTLWEMSDIVSSVDIPLHNGSNLDTTLELSNIVSYIDTPHCNGCNLGTTLEVSNIVSNVDTPHCNVSNLDAPLEVSNIVSSADISHQHESNLGSSSEITDTTNNVDISQHNESSLGTSLLASDIISNAGTLDYNGGNLDTPLVVCNVVSNTEQLKAPEVLSRSDSECSDQYFSCDELFTAKTPAGDGFSEHDDDEETKEIPTNLFPCLPAEERVPSTKIMLSRDKALFRICNRNMYAKYKEHFILNKILKRNLKLSVLCPMEKMSRQFLLENDRNDNEEFSQILNTNDSPPSSLKSKVLEKHTQSVTYGKSASYHDFLNETMREKTVERMDCDKEGELDNNQSIISKPFVRNLSLTPDMCSLKCEVRLINYDGLALFWAARSNTAERSIRCDSEFSDSAYSSSDNTLQNTDNSVNRRYVNGIYMDVNSDNETDDTNDKVYFSEVRLEVNSGEAERDPEEERVESSVAAGKTQSEDDAKEEIKDESFSIPKTPTNTENPCGRALKDLEDLRTAIQKAKETRMSASRELRLLQDLLNNGNNERDETTCERTTLAMSDSKLSLPDVEFLNGNHRKGKIMEALSELQQKSTKEASQNKEFWEEEIKKAKEEVSQVCHEKLSFMEGKLRATEDELAKALRENTRLKDQLELRSAAFPVCKCNAEAQQHSDFSHMNGISDEDPKIIPVLKPSAPTKNFWQEWDRLQSDLMKAERKADELNILLNRKLIELNRMQLTLSKQTKEMILLEKAYFQLRSHLSKRKLSKSGLSHQSSSVAKTSTERTSETSSKTTDPEIPP